VEILPTYQNDVSDYAPSEISRPEIQTAITSSSPATKAALQLLSQARLCVLHPGYNSPQNRNWRDIISPLLQDMPEQSQADSLKSHYKKEVVQMEREKKEKDNRKLPAPRRSLGSLQRGISIS
jgi:hypothetical protein